MSSLVYRKGFDVVDDVGGVADAAIDGVCNADAWGADADRSTLRFDIAEAYCIR